MGSMTPFGMPLTEDLQDVDLVEPASDEGTGLGVVLHPVGYRILVQILPPGETLKRWQNSNLVMPDEVRDREWAAQMWATVIALGPEAYKDEKRFQQPWCAPGDCVLMRPYAGTRFMVRGQLYALINDDTVLAIATDPGEIERV